jgi:hypothetical protein
MTRFFAAFRLRSATSLSAGAALDNVSSSVISPSSVFAQSPTTMPQERFEASDTG